MYHLPTKEGGGWEIIVPGEQVPPAEFPDLQGLAVLLPHRPYSYGFFLPGLFCCNLMDPIQIWYADAQNLFLLL